MMKLFRYPVVKLFFHMTAVLPLVWLIYTVSYGVLGADPAKDIQHFTGITALRLVIIIAVIPVIAFYFKLNSLYQVRKLLGLWCFFWATLHLASYFFLEIGAENTALFFSEILSRFYLNLGVAGWLILCLMAVTSSDRIRNLSGRWWKRIHNLLYPLLFIVITHYILAAKTDTPEPAIYLVLVILAYCHRRQQRSKEQVLPDKIG